MLLHAITLHAWTPAYSPQYGEIRVLSSAPVLCRRCCRLTSPSHHNTWYNQTQRCLPSWPINFLFVRPVRIIRVKIWQLHPSWHTLGSQRNFTGKKPCSAHHSRSTHESVKLISYQESFQSFGLTGQLWVLRWRLCRALCVVLRDWEVGADPPLPQQISGFVRAGTSSTSNQRLEWF